MIGGTYRPGEIQLIEFLNFVPPLLLTYFKVQVWREKGDQDNLARRQAMVQEGLNCGIYSH